MKLIDNKFYIPDNMEQYLGDNNALPEELVIEWCKNNIKDTEKFIDIGAHVGTYAWSVAPYCKEVIAFEPTRHNYNMMCANIALANLSHKIQTHNIGLSSEDTYLTFHERDSDGGTNGFDTPYLGEGNTQRLQVKQLDSFIIEDIGLIKIDVEGHELEVLKGAIRTLQMNGFPPILFECWDIPELKEPLWNYLNSMGYSISNASSEEMYIAYKENK
jgi:FkbM family methyltransferase|tara:strand:- start:594 stop:1241 length:648 start_codon:yes stop_codon:yes gene_type:complete